MPELSVIVPVYKVERYLPRCIESILNQTYKDFELILINDGSPDRCGEICNEYAKKDSRIVVIHQENKGVSAARNAGLKIARGKYVSFPDSDDFIELDMFDRMILNFNLNNIDVVICGIRYCDSEGNELREDLKNRSYYDNEQLLSEIFAMPNSLGGACWNKIFKRDCVKTVFFEETMKFAEDWAYLFDAFVVCQNAYKIEDVLYNVVERENSTTRNNKVDSMYRIILGSELLLKRAKKHSIELEHKATNKFLDNCLRYTKLMMQNSEGKKRSLFNRRIHIKYLMLKTLLRAKRTRLLTNSTWNGYFVGMLKL